MQEKSSFGEFGSIVQGRSMSMEMKKDFEISIILLVLIQYVGVRCNVERDRGFRNESR